MISLPTFNGNLTGTACIWGEYLEDDIIPIRIHRIHGTWDDIYIPTFNTNLFMGVLSAEISLLFPSWFPSIPGGSNLICTCVLKWVAKPPARQHI